MSGRKSRSKGCRRERELVHLLEDMGFCAKRVPLSGAAEGFKGDVLSEPLVFSVPPTRPIELTFRWEVKARKDGWKGIYRDLGDNDALALKADGKPWLVVMRLE